jgi:hypothetical protein
MAEEKERGYEKEKTEVGEKEDKETKAKPNLRPAPPPPPWSKYFSKNSLRVYVICSKYFSGNHLLVLPIVHNTIMSWKQIFVEISI